MARPKNLTEAQVNEMISLHKSGKSLPEIGKIFGIKQQSVWHHFKKNNIPVRPNTPKGQENRFARGGVRAHQKAISAVGIAIRKGFLKRSDQCQECGIANRLTTHGRSYIHAHHCDYNKPLEVMWLCKKCHHKWHQENVAIEVND